MRTAQLQRRLAMAMTLSLLAACSSQQPQTLGNLQMQEEPEETAELAAPSHGEVREEYQELLEVVDDEELKEQIRRRIGDVYMLEGDQAELAGDAQQSYYLEAIKSYRDILEKYPNSPDNADILYQLARAYDMEGDQQEALEVLRELTRRHPDYRHSAEANFRKADILFNLGSYGEAEAAYRVASRDRDSRFFVNAHYMMGWSEYKQLGFQDAVEHFAQVLDLLLAPDKALEDLSSPNQTLVGETLHAMSLGLDKLAGSTTVAQLDLLAERPYVWMVYDDLGQYYLEKELYEASAESYRQFVARHPLHERSPVMHRKMIDTYIEGSFPGQAFEEKERFVDAYGLESDYAREWGGTPESVRDTVYDYLDELARNYHARGQQLQAEQRSLEDVDAEPDAEAIAELDTQALEALGKAAGFYQRLIEGFPDRENVVELHFFRAEALYAARRWREAIDDYEIVAYRSGPPEESSRGSDAGYAAILAYEKALEELAADSEAHRRWRRRAANSMLLFAGRYRDDPRSATVQINAAETFFGLEDFRRTLEVSDQLVDREDIDGALRANAYGFAALSHYRLGEYKQAGDDYLSQRRLVPEDSADYRQISERLASSLYRHAEGLMEAGQNPEAIRELLAVKQLTPDSPVRVTAQYDAASLLVELQRWPEAIAELNQLEMLYPEHELAVEFPRKLAFAYQQSEDWQAAAEAYSGLAEADPDQELRREAHYLSAQMYERDGDPGRAAEQLGSYVERYPAPFATNMEARYKLSELYEEMDQPQQRLVWLQRLIDGHGNAGGEANDRSRWLAGWAHMQFGDYHSEEFKRLNLYPPLPRSLPPKNRELEKATEHYESAADSGVFEFVTRSTYRIGELYRLLAEDLRAAPAPAGLREEEKVLYAEIVAEQARPFEDLAEEVHRSNVERLWQGELNQWINQSFARLRALDPGRFAKTEVIVNYGDEIR